jgi:hypothetical protein
VQAQTMGEQGKPIHAPAHLVLPQNSSIKFSQLYQSRHLCTQGRQRIREFVQQGGGYLGICAGAFLGARHRHKPWTMGLLDAVFCLPNMSLSGTITLTSSASIRDVESSSSSAICSVGDGRAEWFTSSAAASLSQDRNEDDAKDEESDGEGERGSNGDSSDSRRTRPGPEDVVSRSTSFCCSHECGPFFEEDSIGAEVYPIAWLEVLIITRSKWVKQQRERGLASRSDPVIDLIIRTLKHAGCA